MITLYRHKLSSVKNPHYRLEDNTNEKLHKRIRNIQMLDKNFMHENMQSSIVSARYLISLYKKINDFDDMNGVLGFFKNIYPEEFI